MPFRGPKRHFALETKITTKITISNGRDTGALEGMHRVVLGALVPTFNDFAAPEKRDELRRLVFTLVNLVILIMAVASLVFLVIAPWVVSNVLEPGFTPPQKLLTIQFARIIFFSLIALGPFAVLQGTLYARKEFGWAAFAKLFAGIERSL